MPYKCPMCRSERIGIRNYAKKTCCIFGTVAGIAGGAEIGATTGLVAGPIGIVIGSISGAIIGGLVGGAAGGTTGTKLGIVIDDNILNNYQCLSCRHAFCKRDSQPEEFEDYFNIHHPLPHNSPSGFSHEDLNDLESDGA